jgi:hypothetical protein
MIPLTPDIVRTIQTSCRPLLEREAQFHREFHQSLVELMPDVAVLREPDGERIAQLMASCVLWAVFAPEPADVVAATLQGVGLDAHRLGFPRSGYQSVGHALLRSVRVGYYGDWSGNLSSSWIGYHGWLCEHWLHGADNGLFEERNQPAPLPPTGSLLVSSVLDPGAVEAEIDAHGGGRYDETVTSMPLGSNRSARWRGWRRPAAKDDASDRA